MISKIYRTAVFIFIFAGISLGFVEVCFSSEKPGALYVCAATSLSDAMTDAVHKFKKLYETEVYLNFAGSNTLRIQIENGAPCDIFISANFKNVEQLIEKQLAAPEASSGFAANSLVVIAKKDYKIEINSLEELPAKITRYLSLADPETVPAGIYAKESLEKAGVWDDLKQFVAPALDVRAALRQVEYGNAEMGIVYRTDAQGNPNIQIVYEIPVGQQPSIHYALSFLKASKNKVAAHQFLGFLETAQAKDIFKKYGFTLI